MRSNLICIAFSAIPLLAACDEKAGAEIREKQDRRESHGEEAVGPAVEREPSSAPATNRDDFKNHMRGNIDALNKRIEGLDARAKTATGDTKAKLETTLPEIKARRAAMLMQLERIGAVTEESWDSTTADLEREWTQLKSAVDDAEY